MRLLEAGRPQQGWSMQKRCTGRGNGGGGCDALLLVEQGDVFSTESHARDETTRYATFECPGCGVLTDFSNGEVPSHVLGAMKSHKEWRAAR